MGAPPAVVIVVRHGARLDATDKQWHLTSPTPYDPPLTFGGWLQSRALGARIASILRSRETDDYDPNSASGSNDVQSDENGRRRRHKVIIHTSPFLRCVQTSIAISSGLAQNPGHTHNTRPLSSHSTKSATFYSSPRIRPTVITESPRLSAIQEPIFQAKAVEKADDVQFNTRRSTLRVDAFLGEWLTPDYFELITPPPGSVMMVAGAKADLLRREDYSNLVQVREAPTSAKPFQGFPGGWGSPVVAAISDQEDAPLPSLSSLAQALPRRDRTSSLSSAGSSSSGHRAKIISKMVAATPGERGVYHPPMPTYAISNAEAIPPGYVAHARDACVNVDYQWDSMREPQNWGNGGEYGEEWSSMHKRFRRGLQQLIYYYREVDDSTLLASKLNVSKEERANVDCNDVNDEDVDLVVILVTHGAGCNALIGALTNQPVLLDVGMASLTMAVRKPSPRTTPEVTPGDTPRAHVRRPSQISTISDEYDVKLIANTEHLQTSRTSTPSSSRAPSLAGAPIPQPFRSSNGGGTFVEPDRSRSMGNTSNFGSIRRAASAVTTPLSRTYNPPKLSSGLWSAPKAAEDAGMDESGDDMMLNFGDDGARSSQVVKQEQEHAIDEQLEVDDLPPLGGLWGSPKTSGDPDIVRYAAPKRRWTVNEPGIT